MALDYSTRTDAGWSSLVARRAHNPKVAGSNPAPATTPRPRRCGVIIVSGRVVRTPYCSPEFGTQVITGTRTIKSAIEQFRNEVGRIQCTIQRQIKEGDWVATSCTSNEANGVHMGTLFNRVVAGKLTESLVVARTLSVAEARISASKASNRPTR